MKWIDLNTKSMRAAHYDPEMRVLLIKFIRIGIISHSNIPQHVYDNLIETPDADFYYSYYIRPNRDPKSKPSFKAQLGYRIFYATIFASSLLAPSALDGDILTSQPGKQSLVLNEPR